MSVGVGRYHSSLRSAPPEPQSLHSSKALGNTHKHTLLRECKMAVSVQGSLAISAKSRMHLPYDSAIPILEVEAKDTVKKYKTDMCMRLFICCYL